MLDVARKFEEFTKDLMDIDKVLLDFGGKMLGSLMEPCRILVDFMCFKSS